MRYERERRHAFETDPQYYRYCAAGMLSVLATGERNAVRLVQLFHPEYAGASEADIRAAQLTQDDAELILAREHGFEAFEALARSVEALREKPTPFRLAFEAIKANARDTLRELLKSNPGLVNAAGTNCNRLIMLAMSFGRIAMVEDLLDAGADPGLPEQQGLDRAAPGGLCAPAERSGSRAGHAGAAACRRRLTVRGGLRRRRHAARGRVVLGARAVGGTACRGCDRAVQSARRGRPRPPRPDARRCSRAGACARKPAPIANSIARTAAFRPGGRPTRRPRSSPRR